MRKPVHYRAAGRMSPCLVVQMEVLPGGEMTLESAKRFKQFSFTTNVHKVTCTACKFALKMVLGGCDATECPYAS